jgi:tetratricopeptide (TPR) repeat protein
VRHKWAKLLIFLAACGASRDIVRSQNRLDIARDLLAKGEVVGAEAEAKKALVHDPKSEEAENLLGLVYVMRAHQSAQLVEKADCLSDTDATALRAQSDEQMRAAGEHFYRATELAADYGEAWANRSVVAMYFHDWDGAIELGKKALAHLDRLESPPLTHANLGWSYYQKQDFMHAVTELLQANQGGQYFCLGKYRLASVYFARKEFDTTAEALAPIFADDKLCPPLQEAQYLGGQAFLRLRDRDAATRAFNACVDMAPRSCQARECKKALESLDTFEADAQRASTKVTP